MGTQTQTPDRCPNSIEPIQLFSRMLRKVTEFFLQTDPNELFGSYACEGSGYLTGCISLISKK